MYIPTTFQRGYLDPLQVKNPQSKKKEKKKKLQKTGKVGHSHVVQDLWAAVEVAFTSVN